METNTKEFKPLRVYRDELFEMKTRHEMDASRMHMQAIADAWLKMGIGDVPEIHGLLMRPQTVYDNKINAMIDAPKTDGKFAVKKSAYMDTLALPDPSALIGACNSAKQQTWCGVPGLWDMDGGTVVLNDDTAAQYIDSQSIYANTPERAEFVNDMQKFCDMFNDMNKRTKGELINPMDSFLNRWAIGKFIIRSYGADDTRIEMHPDAVKHWLSL
jgi:hypothetical protein